VGHRSAATDHDASRGSDGGRVALCVTDDRGLKYALGRFRATRLVSRDRGSGTWLARRCVLDRRDGLKASNSGACSGQEPLPSAILKAARGLRLSWVRIPRPPLEGLSGLSSWAAVFDYCAAATHNGGGPGNFLAGNGRRAACHRRLGGDGRPVTQGIRDVSQQRSGRWPGVQESRPCLIWQATGTASVVPVPFE
jgi:hypothetical protein